MVASARPKARRRGARTRLRRPLRRQCDDRQITADTDLEWVAQGAPAATNATGEIDYGHIDPMTWGSGLYELQGYWGERRVRAPAARVVFEDSSLRAWGGLMVEGPMAASPIGAQRVRLVGYWRGPTALEWPDPKDFVDTTRAHRVRDLAQVSPDAAAVELSGVRPYPISNELAAKIAATPGAHPSSCRDGDQ